VPERAVRLEAETSGGAVYPAICHEGRWSVKLPADDRSETVVIRAVGPNGETVSSELCLMSAPDPDAGLRRIASWFTRHVRRAHRGVVTYGPR
jgi:hypothetical protein